MCQVRKPLKNYQFAGILLTRNFFNRCRVQSSRWPEKWGVKLKQRLRPCGVPHEDKKANIEYRIMNVEGMYSVYLKKD